MDNANGDKKDLNLSRDMYSLRIKSTLKALYKMSFENFLKEHIETAPEVSSFDIFRNAVFDVVLAVEYAIKEKDCELIALSNELISRLELEGTEDSILGKSFAKLLIKARNICEAGLNLKEIFVTFEFNHFLREFKDKIVKKVSTGNKINENREFYELMTHYSNN